MLTLNKEESELILKALLYRPFGGKKREKLINKIVENFPTLKSIVDEFNNAENKTYAFDNINKDTYLDCV